MSSDLHAELSALLDMLRAKGVTHARLEPMTLPSAFGVIDVTFALTELRDVAEEAGAKLDEDMCGCGHALYNHANGLCQHGCELEKCSWVAK